VSGGRVFDGTDGRSRARPAGLESAGDAEPGLLAGTEQEHRAGRLPADWEYRLPTEAQWEYACRAGAKTHFCFGNDLHDLGPYGWYGSHKYPHLVGGKKPNNWGFFDMHGNVSEWCRDTLTPTLPGGRDPESTQPGASRVHRGGHFRDAAAHCMSACRGASEQGTRLSEIGFRLAAVRVD
jgi:sulfatase modifying factor 1